MAIFTSDFAHRSPWNFAIWLGWLVAAYLVYRRAIRDLYVLAGGALSVIIVAACFLGKALPMRDAGEFLFIGLVVIALIGCRRLVAAHARGGERGMTGEALWLRLREARLVEGDMPASEPAPPWFVRLMLGIAGWLGAIFLLAFVGIGFAALMRSPTAGIAVGAAVCVAAVFPFPPAAKG
jgi:hypothetical protein